MKCLRLVVVSVVAALIVAVTAGASASGTTSSSFCDDTAQLQDWLAQNFRPGIDQLDEPPNSPYVLGMAQYLQKLSEEAPAAAKDDLSIWAAFTQKVGSQASQDDLAAGVQAARESSSRVEAWLEKESGCEQLYSVAAPSPLGQTSQGILYWVIGLVVLLILGGLVGLLIRRGRGGSGRVPGGGQNTVPPVWAPSADNDLWAAPTPEPCLRCNGLRTEICNICFGTGSSPTYDSGGAQFGSSTGACLRCSATGRITCTNCNGSGTRS